MQRLWYAWSEQPGLGSVTVTAFSFWLKLGQRAFASAAVSLACLRLPQAQELGDAQAASSWEAVWVDRRTCLPRLPEHMIHDSL